ncbi:MAG: alpha/beta hydrolase fold domain-containing protein [Armatimonadetes bacterium]|nr:alpha/beta hydrolase fold domain-containing protein [Armatimonadota bacterium]
MRTRLYAATVLLVFVLVWVSICAVLAQVPDVFKKFDKNGDGVLTADELDPKLFKSLDSDGDGKVVIIESKSVTETGEPKGGESISGPEERDVKYGPHERQVLDFWRAKSDKPTPLLVFIPGTEFIDGDKMMIPPAALKRALDAGASVVSINYRLLKDAPIQDILRDTARAVQFMRLEAARFNVDPRRIGCFGYAFGGGASLWLATHPDLADVGSEDLVLRQSSRVSAAACLDGQATFNVIEWDRLIHPFDLRFREHPDEDFRLYHFKSRADLESEDGRKILADCSMVGLLTSDDPPIYMYCSLPDGEPKDRTHMLSHPKHVEVIRKKAEEVGVKFESHLASSDKQAPADKTNAYVNAVEFLLKQMGLIGR